MQTKIIFCFYLFRGTEEELGKKEHLERQGRREKMEMKAVMDHLDQKVPVVCKEVLDHVVKWALQVHKVPWELVDHLDQR